MTSRGSRLTQLRATFPERSSLRVVWVVTSQGHPLDELADDARGDLAVELTAHSWRLAGPEFWHVTRSDEGQTVLVADVVVRTAYPEGRNPL
jgi:hypothetical protein